MNIRNLSFFLSRLGRVASTMLLLLPFAVFCGRTQAQEAKPIARKQQSADTSISEGRQLFESRCAGCHGLDGRGGERAPDIATRQNVQRRSDNDLLRIIESGLPASGMPSFASLGTYPIQMLVSYLRQLQGKGGSAKLPGNPRAGKVLFFGKARCSECHMVNGAGGFIASDLSAFGSTRSAEEIRQAITKPSQENSLRQGTVIVTTRDGDKLSGMVRNEDNFSLQLQTLDGAFHLLMKPEVAEIDRKQKPLMPSDYGSKLNPSELNDLISFLMSTANNGKSHSAKPSESKHSEENE
jgi:putative heme-binding domain-containing protein